jgi:hypothetical protein
VDAVTSWITWVWNEVLGNDGVRGTAGLLFIALAFSVTVFWAGKECAGILSEHRLRRHRLNRRQRGQIRQKLRLRLRETKAWRTASFRD